LAKPFGLAEGQLIQRRAATDQLVVVRNLRDTLGGDPASRRDDLQERADILRLLRPAERDQHD
jgi:hypothetical protein